MSLPGEFESMLIRQRDRALSRLSKFPDDAMAKLLVHNRTQAIADLRAEQRLVESRKIGELIELRLLGPRVDQGSVPLEAFLKVLAPWMRACRAISERQRYGVAKLTGKLKRATADELNLKLSGVGVGSTRLLLTGNGIPDITGNSLLYLTLQHMLELLNANSNNILDAVDKVGVTGARALGDFADAVNSAGMAAEISWPFGDSPLHWIGNTDELLRIKALLKSVSDARETEIYLEGEVASISDTGRIHLRVPNLGRVTVKYSLNQMQAAQQLVVATHARLHVLSTAYFDPIRQVDVPKYNLLNLAS